MASWIIGIVVFAALILAIRKTIKDHKSGKSVCGCSGCSGCSFESGCNQFVDQTQEIKELENKR